MGHQITAMFEWMKHTDNTLHARLKDDIHADDVPAEAEKLILEFNQYEAFLRSIEDKVHQLRSTGKNEAAKRLEQQLLLLRVTLSSLSSNVKIFFLRRSESIFTITNEISLLSKTLGFRTKISENASNSSRCRTESFRSGDSFR